MCFQRRFFEGFGAGADKVYSATKHIDGQGRMLGGVILSNAEFISGTIEPYMSHGGAMSPFTAWVMLKGLKQLNCGRAQAETAALIAQDLSGHSALTQLIISGTCACTI